MVGADRDRSALVDRFAHGRCQFEAQPVHGRGFFLVFSLEVLVRNRAHAACACDLDIAAILDPAQVGKCHPALTGIGILDHQGRLPVAAVGNQRIVGIELLADSAWLEYALDAQHFLHLVLDRQAVLEGPRHVGADRHGARALVRDHARTKSLAALRVLLETHQVRFVERASAHSLVQSRLLRCHRPAATGGSGAPAPAPCRDRPRSGARPSGNRSRNDRPPRSRPAARPGARSSWRSRGTRS